MAPKSIEQLVVLLRLPNEATLADQVLKPQEVHKLYTTYAADVAIFPEGANKCSNKKTVRLAIDSLNNTGLNLVGVGGQPLDKSQWNINHHTARLLLLLSTALSAPDGPLFALKTSVAHEDYFKALYEIYLKLAHSIRRRKSKPDKGSPKPSLPLGQELATPRTSTMAFSPNLLSPEKAIKILWQWMTAPTEPLNRERTGIKELTFGDAKNTVDTLFDLINEGHEFAKFVYPKLDVDVTDEEGWVALVAQLAQEIEENELRQVTIEVHTLDLKSDFRPRLRIGGTKSKAAEVADMEVLLENANKAQYFKNAREMLEELEKGTKSREAYEPDTTDLSPDHAAQTLFESDAVDVKSRNEFAIPNSPANIAHAKELLEWLNSDKLYGRDALSPADMAEFGMETSEFGTYMSGMAIGRYLTFYQAPAIKALYDMVQQKGAAMLSDDVGLGKTLQLILVLAHAYNVRQRVPASERDPPKPSLLVVPHSLIQQWAQEIKKFVPSIRILLFYGNGYSGIKDGIDSEINGELTCDHEIFDGSNEDNARTIIITSLDTLAKRNGLDSIITDDVWQEIANKSGVSLADAKSRGDWSKWRKTNPVHFLRQYTVLTGRHAPISTADLRGKFAFIICDEAHKIKNEGASRTATIAAFSDRTMAHAPKLLLATATPILNTVNDIFGLLQLLEDPLAWTTNRVVMNGQTPTELDVWHSKWDGDARIAGMRMTCKALEPLKEDHNALMPRLRQVLVGCMVRRSYGSRVAGKLLGEALPNTHTRVKQVEFRAEEYQVFLNMTKKRSRKLMQATKTGELNMASTSVHDLSLSQVFLPLGESKKLGQQKGIEKFIKAGKTAWDMLETLASERTRMPWFGDWMDKHGMPDREDNLGILRCFLEWSPKLRFVVDAVLDLVVLQQEKVLLWTHFPAEQELVKLVVGLLPVNVASYHTGLTVGEQSTMLEDFRSPEHEVQVLVASAMRDYFGLNMQGACANCIFVTEPTSHPRAQQQIGRILRLGAQHRWIRVIYIRLDSALDEYVALQNLRKALAPVGFRINVDHFGRGVLSAEDSLESDNVFRIGNVVPMGKSFAVLTPDQMADLNLPALTEAILAAMITQCEIRGSTTLSDKELQVIREEKIPKLDELIREHEGRRGKKRAGVDMDNSAENIKVQIQATLNTDELRAAWPMLSAQEQAEVISHWPSLKGLDEED